MKAAGQKATTSELSQVLFHLSAAFGHVAAIALLLEAVPGALVCMVAVSDWHACLVVSCHSSPMMKGSVAPVGSTARCLP